MIDEKDISFSPVQEEDFEDFKTLRKSVMREHVERLGLKWDETAEDNFHRELFDAPGLRIIKYKNYSVGYVGVAYKGKKDRVVIGRICLRPEYQKKGIGTAVMKKIFNEPICQGRTLFLDVLQKNPAIRLYKRLGFRKIAEDRKLAYFEKEIDAPSTTNNVTHNKTQSPRP